MVSKMQTWNEHNVNRLVVDEKVIPIQDSEFMVQSQNDDSVFYSVDVVQGSCTCPHHTYRHIECKHIKAAKEVKHLNNSKGKGT